MTLVANVILFYCYLFQGGGGEVLQESVFTWQNLGPMNCRRNPNSNNYSKDCPFNLNFFSNQ